MNKKKAFSLIELMVVIVIVGILAAIALPNYKVYIMSAKVGSAVPAIQDLMSQSILYANTHGRFGNPYDLGLSTSNLYGTSAGLVDEPSSFNQYFANPSIGSGSLFGLTLFFGDTSATNVPGVTQPCGATGEIMGTFDPSKIGSASNDLIAIGCQYWHSASNVMQSFCFYTGFDLSNNLATLNAGELVPGWVNMGDPNSAQALANANEELQAATCQ